jgi:hypothetical protein
MEDQEEETQSTGRVRLSVNFGQTVIPLQGIVQRKVVIAFVMGAHERVGRDSPVRILDDYPDLLRLVCFFADIWREFHPGLVYRLNWANDTAAFHIRSNLQLSDPRFNPLAEPLPESVPDTLVRYGHWVRWLDRYVLDIETGGDAQALTWTDPQIL